MTQSKFFWYELMTSDQDAALAFYKRVVGWSAVDSGQPDQRYTILSAGDRGMGGIMTLPAGAREGGMRPGWVGYVHVPDTDAAVKKAVEGGAKLHMGPDDIPAIGRFAMLADPGGALFYLMTPLPREDEPPPADPTTLGLVSWRELYAGNGQKAAFDFYSSQFGWETMHEMDMGPMGTYRIFGADGEQMGGMMDKPERMPASAWNFYVNVDSVDAAVERIKAEGGQIVMGPIDVPGGSWVVQGLDPQGAAFALISQTR
jgi:predicted enzyme related to lactoylglutathione lyase